MATEMETEIDGDGEYGAIQSVHSKCSFKVLSDLEKLKEASTSKKTDTEILQALVNNPVVQSLAKAHTAMIEKKISPTSQTASDLSQRIGEQVDELTGDSSYQELRNLLNKPHITNLLKCHDMVAKKNELNLEQLHGTAANKNGNGHFGDAGDFARLPRAIRMVGMNKRSWEPLGLTVVKENGQLKVARILRGSEIERKALLHIDDIILEINGNPLKGDPTKLQEYLLKTSGSIVFKILPSYQENAPPKLLYVKCHIDYDPKTDDLIPCVDAGLGFKRGEILQVVEQTDEDWWQAQKVNNKGEARGRAGLIPSQSYEEKRRAIQEMKRKTLPEKKKSRKRKSMRRMYSAAQNSAFDKHDIAVYEEVACIPPFFRKTLVLLIQSRHLGEEISQAIVEKKSDVYGVPEKMEPEMHGSGEVNGTDELHSEQFAQNRELNPARVVMREGKTCVLTATPQSLKLLRTSEFMPYVVFVKLHEEDEQDLEKSDQAFDATSSDIEKYYMQYVDTIIDHTTTPAVAQAIIDQLEQLKTKHQWVPTSWVY